MIIVHIIDALGDGLVSTRALVYVESRVCACITLCIHNKLSFVKKSFFI
jgi:hypothetical protein